MFQIAVSFLTGDANLEQVLADAPFSATRPAPPKSDALRLLAPIRLERLLHFVLLGFAAVFLALHFVHLTADFPNHSPWMDWSKYTDEGWYGDGAIRQTQFHHWYIPGDFNPAAALPVWPLLEFLIFSFTGVSLVAARALSVGVFGAALAVAYVLVRRCGIEARTGGETGFSLAGAAGVALLAANPFCYAFTRLAILEPLVVLLGMLALLAATFRVRWLAIVSLGILIPMMILTKTTAAFLLPSIAWMLWASSGYRLRGFLQVGVPAAGLAAALWSGYFFLIVRPWFLEDYRYLFSANGYTGITRENAWGVILTTFRDGIWMGTLVYPVALIAMGFAVVCCRRTFRNPLVPALILWVLGYGSFLAYHNNLQPRYYLVIAIPLTILLTVVAEEIYSTAPGWLTPARPVSRTMYKVAVVSVLAVILETDAIRTVEFARSPQYTFLNAAKNLRKAIANDSKKGQSELVLSISGSNLSLMTGLPSICDDFGTMALEDRVAKYQPGWYATWNQVDDDKMDALAPMYHLERVAAFPAFDDPERNLLILYRLDPAVEEAPRPKRRKPLPKRLQTKLGQQPSASQLEH